MDDLIGTIQEMYDAVGDAERWQRLIERLAAAPGRSPEIDWHLEIARRAHEEHIGIMRRVETLSSAIDRIVLGAALVDRDRRLLWANAAARRLLADGVGVVLVNERVEATSADENATLCRAIARASSGNKEMQAARGPFILVTRPGQRSLCVVVLRPQGPVPGVFEDRVPVLLLLVDRDLVAVPGPDALRALFGFTAREAELAALLMQGLSLTQAAYALGVTMSTARTFLAHLTAKTDSHSQAELVGRLLAIPHMA